jgi:hypothetical protein
VPDIPPAEKLWGGDSNARPGRLTAEGFVFGVWGGERGRGRGLEVCVSLYTLPELELPRQVM